MKLATRGLIDRVVSGLFAREPHAKVAVAVTGGGTSVAQWLFAPGSSSTMLAFTVPYARACLEGFVEHSATPPPPGTKFCSAEMAEAMARAAWDRAGEALWATAQEEPKAKAQAASIPATLGRFHSAIGVGCTAALATTYDRRGLNQGFISICHVRDRGHWVERECATYHVLLDKSVGRTREEEDQRVGQYLIYLLGRHAGVASEACEELHAALAASGAPGDRFEALAKETSDEGSVMDPLAELLGDGASSALQSVAFLPSNAFCDTNGGGSATTQLPPSTVVKAMPFKGIVLPGSFNPLHEGHVELIRAAARTLKSQCGDDQELPAMFEIAVANADKGNLTSAVVLQRVGQFVDATANLGQWPVMVTNATYFSQKAELLPGCAFVIGADTAVRLVDKKYYDMDPYKMVLVLEAIARKGCRFIVAGRFDDKIHHRFISAEEVMKDHIPSIFQDMFIPLREDDFRNDLSSTQIRQRQANE